jgi:uncharacterized Zn finger protein (UPF0148 family)
MKCLNCGNEIKEGQKFCINCGTPVPQPEDTPAQDTAAQAEQPIEEAPQSEEQAAPAEETSQSEEPAAKADEPATQAEEQVLQAENQATEAENQAAQREDAADQAASGVVPVAAIETSTAAYSTEKSADAILASIPKEYKPLTIGQFFGYEVLFSLPFVGVIASLIFALDASRNINLTNFARARFLWTVVETMITLFMFLMMVIRIL